MSSAHELAREVRARLSRATVRLQEGNFEAAREQVEVALQLDPEFAPALALQARIQHEMAEAIAALSLQVPATSPPAESQTGVQADHTAVPAWQSFELRMQARRAARCASTAREALGAGRVSAAREAIEELQHLDPRRADVLMRELGPVLPPPRPRDAAGPGAAGSYASTGSGGRRTAIGLVWLSAAALVILAGAGDRGRVADREIGQIVLVEPRELAAEPAPLSRRPAPLDDDAISLPAAAGPPDAASSEAEAGQARLQTIPPPGPPAGPRPTAAASGSPAGTRPPPAPTGSGESAPTRPAAEPEPLQEEAATLAPEHDPPALLPAVALPRDDERMSARTVIDPGATLGSLAAPRPEETAIRQALDRYERAYNDLDASAARAVWPSVDYRALARAFQGLESQHVVLERCTIETEGERARASCRGRATFVPRVGSRSELNEFRRWTFTLHRAGEAWRIEHVDAR